MKGWSKPELSKHFFPRATWAIKRVPDIKRNVIVSGYILFYCCDRKARAAYAQSFALWQQATIEFTCHDHSSRTLLLRSVVHIVSIGRASKPRSLFYCLFAPHICVVLFFTHIPFVVNHTINATPPERLQHYQINKFFIIIIIFSWLTKCFCGWMK